MRNLCLLLLCQGVLATAGDHGDAGACPSEGVLATAGDHGDAGACPSEGEALIQKRSGLTATAPLEEKVDALVEEGLPGEPQGVEFEKVQSNWPWERRRRNRRRRDRRRTTTTTTTTPRDCGEEPYTSYSLNYGSRDGNQELCICGSKNHYQSDGFLVEETKGDACDDSSRKRWLLEDGPTGYCQLVAKYSASSYGEKMSCGEHTLGFPLTTCKVGVDDSDWNKFKIQDRGNGKFSLKAYSDGGEAKDLFRHHNDPFGLIVGADDTSRDEVEFRLFKNAQPFDECLLTAADLDLSCWV